MMSGYLHRFGFSSLMKNKPELANRGGTAFQLLQMIDCDPFYGEAIRVALHNMYEAGDINRAQARSLRRNIYVMQVDADSGI